MAWDTDLVSAVYTAPSGKKFVFQYDPKLSSETDLKTATYTFPDKNGALVVPLGVGGKRFPFSCFFYGQNSKNEADDFEAGLKELGYGQLQHPLYGSFKVVPTGTINRSDDVVNGVGVSSVAVVFAETITDGKSIDSEVISSDNIDAASEAYEESASGSFSNELMNIRS